MMTHDWFRADLLLLAFALATCAAALAQMAVWTWRTGVARVRHWRLARELDAAARAKDREQRAWRRTW